MGEQSVDTVGDLLGLFPREYILPAEKRSLEDAAVGESAVFDVEIESIRLTR